MFTTGRFGIAVLVVAVGAAFWVMNSRPSDQDEVGSKVSEDAPLSRNASATSAQTHASSPIPSDPAASTADRSATDPTPSADSKQTTLDKMHEASITYDPSQLPVIRPYLVHPDAEIREAAVNAMVVLGDASAGPMLREAAKLAPTAKEAVAMEEAADYVELPSANLNELLKGKDGGKR